MKFVPFLLTYYCCISSALSCDTPPEDDQMIVSGLPDSDNPILPDRFLTFSCKGPGTILNGSSVLICGKDGQWDSPFPTCEGKTSQYKYLNVRFDRHTVFHDKLRFMCSRHYLSGAATAPSPQGYWTFTRK